MEYRNMVSRKISFACSGGPRPPAGGLFAACCDLSKPGRFSEALIFPRSLESSFKGALLDIVETIVFERGLINPARLEYRLNLHLRLFGNF